MLVPATLPPSDDFINSFVNVASPGITYNETVNNLEPEVINDVINEPLNICSEPQIMGNPGIPIHDIMTNRVHDLINGDFPQIRDQRIVGNEVEPLIADAPVTYDNETPVTYSNETPVTYSNETPVTYSNQIPVTYSEVLPNNVYGGYPQQFLPQVGAPQISNVQEQLRSYLEQHQNQQQVKIFKLGLFINILNLYTHEHTCLL